METDGKVRQQLVREVTVMLSYALEEGLALDPNVAALIGGEQAGASTHVSFASQPTSSLTALHVALAKVVTPATPGSLEATAPAPGPFGFLLNPPLIGLMVLAAIACAFGFVVTLDPTRTAASKWNLLFSAGLGSAFYGLFTAHDYVKNRTFDPRYNSVYLIRFVLGIIAGLILASLGVADQNDTLKKLGLGVIALLGGYSAEAVNQVLQRLVDILLAAVKGGGGDVAKAKEEEVKAKAATQVTSAKQSMSQELSDLLSDSALPEPLRGKLKDIQSRLK
jgi:uncharacterized membrane protein